MAYMNSLIAGAKLALAVSVMLTIYNGVFVRFTGETLESKIDRTLPRIGGGQ